MNILIIQGPNLNLIGSKSAKSGKRITLDKINRAIKHLVREKDIELKIYQTHSVERVITLLQRNRKWADGIIIAPGAWSTYEIVIADTLQLIEVQTIEVYDEEDNQDYMKQSILTKFCKKTITAPAEDMFIKALKSFI
jgi:3-dehydroquinate dehydratase-2